MAIPLLAIKAILAGESESSKAAESINKWAKGKEYKKGALVYYTYHFWESLIDANKGQTPGEDATKWTDLGLLDLSVNSSADLSSIEVGYLPDGAIVAGGGGAHYIYLPSGSTTTSPVVGNWYLKEQLDFDARYKIGCHLMVFSTDDLPYPTSPATCTWTLDSSFNNKSIWINTTATLGANQGASAPKIEGYFGAMMLDDSSGKSASGAFFFNGTPRTRTWAGESGDGIRNMGFQASRSWSGYSRTDGLIIPTSVITHIYKRTS